MSAGIHASRQVHSVGKLHVHVKSAEFKNVRSFELIGKIDPYIKVALFNEVHKTKAHDNTEAPTFDEEFQITSVAARGVRLFVEAWDKDLLSNDDVIGTGHHTVEDKVYSGMPMDVTVTLTKQEEDAGGGEATKKGVEMGTWRTRKHETRWRCDTNGIEKIFYCCWFSPVRLTQQIIFITGNLKLHTTGETLDTVHLDDTKIESLLNLFLVLDANENGTIDTEEFAALGKAMTGRKQSTDYVLSQMRRADSNQDDCLDVAEFIKFSEVLGSMNERVFANTINNYTKKLVRERERRERADTEKSKSRSDSFFF